MCLYMDRQAINPFVLEKPTFSHFPTSRTRMASSISKSRPLLFVFLCFINVAQQQQQNQLLDIICVKEKGTFARNSIYHANLHHLLSTIASNTRINYGFYKASYGAKRDQVNAIALCRGDVHVASCRQCIYRSASVLQKRCPNLKEAVIWHDNCMLRYSNRYFFGNMEFGPWFWMFNPTKVPNPGAFTRTLRSLLNRLIFKAASGSSLLKYATGSIATRRNPPNIYALVQCSPDLSKQGCITCLNKATALLPNCCAGKQGGRVIAPSCNFRYEIGRFYG